MSQFKTLLRQSKVFSLPPQSLRIVSPDVPVQQVLSTTSSSHFRRNWGIKGSLPQKAESTLLTLGALENSRSLPEVEYGAPSARRAAMFREFGRAVDSQGQGEFRSLLEAGPRAPRTIATLAPRAHRALVRGAAERTLEYKAAVRRDRASAASQRVEQRAERFAGLEPVSHTTQRVAHSPFGLSYALKGTLHNTPRGLVKSHATPGRALPRGANQKAAVGGFIGRLTTKPTLPDGAVSHEKPVPLIVDRVASDRQGRLSISLFPALDKAAARGGRTELDDKLDKLIF